jgi:hypothetical protein
MPRPAAPCLALALGLLAACTPTGEPPGEGWEPSPAGWRRRAEPVARHRAGPPAPAAGDPACGAIAPEPLGEWEDEGDALGAIRAGWHPRPEHGVPVSVRELRSPVPLPGYRLWLVEVARAARSTTRCITPSELPAGEWGVECVPAWRLAHGLTPEARPRTHAQWAELLALAEDASAVYPDLATLERCVPELPAAARAAMPPLGQQPGEEGVEHVFVERVEVDASLTLLVTVKATVADQHVALEHHELWARMREVAP